MLASNISTNATAYYGGSTGVVNIFVANNATVFLNHLTFFAN
jgi:hypothetical protein